MFKLMQKGNFSKFSLYIEFSRDAFYYNYFFEIFRIDIVMLNKY